MILSADEEWSNHSQQDGIVDFIHLNDYFFKEGSCFDELILESAAVGFISGV